MTKLLAIAAVLLVSSTALAGRRVTPEAEDEEESVYDDRDADGDVESGPRSKKSKNAKKSKVADDAGDADAGDVDDEDEVRPTKKAKTAKKAKVVDDDDDAGRPSKKAKPAKKSKVVDDDDDAADDEVRPSKKSKTSKSHVADDEDADDAVAEDDDDERPRKKTKSTVADAEDANDGDDDAGEAGEDLLDESGGQDADEVTRVEEPEAPPSLYAAVSLGAGVQRAFQFSAQIDGALSILHPRLFLRVGGTQGTSGDGKYYQLRVGLEGRLCSDSEWLCAVVGADIGYQRDKAQGVFAASEMRWMIDAHDLVTVPRVGVELGHEMKVRITVEAPYIRRMDSAMDGGAGSGVGFLGALGVARGF